MNNEIKDNIAFIGILIIIGLLGYLAKFILFLIR